MAPRLVTKNLVDMFSSHGRSRGRHVTSALYSVMSSLHPDRFDSGGSPRPDVTRMTLGNAMEAAIASAFARKWPDRYIRPGELEKDGVFGTPDLWDLEEWATVEIKLTWASSRRAEDIEDPWFWRYWAQLKTYVFMANQEKGYLIIFFINGNYSKDKDDPENGPQGYMWEETWSKEELSETWNMIQNYSEEESGYETTEDEQ
jgi:hypothetical protein